MVFSSSYALGLFFIFLVSIIWSAASILVQYLYEDQSFDSPFLLTYIGTSLFTILLPLDWISTNFCYPLYRRQQHTQIHDNNGDGAIVMTATTSGSSIGSDGGEYASISTHNNNQINNTIVTANEDSHSPPSAMMNRTNHDRIWSIRDHYMAAVKIAPVWFISNYSYNASLKFTSITSSTVLACTGSLFTFLFALLLKDEQFEYMKLLGVLLGMTGSMLTGLHDIGGQGEDNANSSHQTNLSVWGDALGLLSAIGYGAYAIMVRILCPKDESLMKMQVFLGFVGLWNMTLLSPVVIYMGFTGALSSLTALVLGFLIVKGLFDNVLSDYLWARSVVLTSATVASVGLGLTIPLAFVSDIFKGRPDVLSLESIAGAFSVLAGFILVNLGQQKELQEEELHNGGEDNAEIRQQLAPLGEDETEVDGIVVDEVTPLDHPQVQIQSSSNPQQKRQDERRHMSMDPYSDDATEAQPLQIV